MEYTPVMAPDSDGEITEWVEGVADIMPKRCDFCKEPVYEFWTPLTGDTVDICGDCMREQIR